MKIMRPQVDKLDVARLNALADLAESINGSRDYDPQIALNVENAAQELSALLQTGMPPTWGRQVDEKKILRTGIARAWSGNEYSAVPDDYIRLNGWIEEKRARHATRHFLHVAKRHQGVLINVEEAKFKYSKDVVMREAERVIEDRIQALAVEFTGKTGRDKLERHDVIGIACSTVLANHRTVTQFAPKGFR